MRWKFFSVPQTLSCSQIKKKNQFATSSISYLVFRGLRQVNPLKCKENVLVAGLVFVFDKRWLMQALLFLWLMTFISLIILELYNIILINHEPSENMKMLCKKIAKTGLPNHSALLLLWYILLPMAVQFTNVHLLPSLDHLLTLPAVRPMHSYILSFAWVLLLKSATHESS